MQTHFSARYISKLSNKIRRRLDACSVKGTFSGAQGRTLHFILAQTGDVFQKDIEEEFSLRPPTATELLKKMEQSGLIRREPAEYDARLKKIIASEKGLQYREKVVGDLQALDRELTKGIAPQDLAVFMRVMERMLHNLS